MVVLVEIQCNTDDSDRWMRLTVQVLLLCAHVRVKVTDFVLFVAKQKKNPMI